MSQEEPQPYLTEEVVTIVKKWNPDYPQDRLCKCGHPYYRHFDPYENNDAVGCKYCHCYDFEPMTEFDCWRRVGANIVRGITKGDNPYECTTEEALAQPNENSERYWKYHGYERQAPIVDKQTS